ncbi:GIY-YIG nuclease family protein [Enterococcus dispar]|uniref:GIY-YIG nuclease family protein n=1 Tax=Enterococcus dispar TaxID=44009 RepID=UPI00288FF859|nr:GIY-YIG nuclease family protein [Enterococcus dispar]MDT2705890.1 GIY-YIG nuclease family protein [Enterococcus dispar]
MYKNFIESFFQLIEEVNQFDKSKLFDYQVHKRPVTGFALQRDLYTNGSTKNSFSLSRHYKEEYPKQEITRMKKNALLNFDYNMRFFDKLDKETYNANINAVLERFPFTQVTSLLEIDRQDSGVYLLCLDDYNQFYVGQGKIFNRITKHWRTTLSIDRLVFGTVEDSRLSIDSFGVFDTKRISNNS